MRVKYKLITTTIFFATFILIPAILFSQDEIDEEMPQYLFPRFAKCDILYKNREVKTQTMNYNTVTEKMVYLHDGKYYDLVTTALIDTVFMQNSKFVPYGKIFQEVLVNGKQTLFLQNKSDLIPAGKPIGYGGTSQAATSFYLTKHELAPEYINMQVPPDVTVKATPVYWILKNEEMLSFTNKKQFLALFAEKGNAIKNFIKKNKIKFDRKDDLVTLVTYVNGL